MLLKRRRGSKPRRRLLSKILLLFVEISKAKNNQSQTSLFGK